MLRLPALLRANLAGFSCARYPHEACGLLLGRRHGETSEAVLALEARNLDTTRAHERFELDPADHLAGEERARTLGLEVIGIWHSHPDRPAQPSALDRAQAWAAWSYVIVAVVAGEVVELRAWRLAGEHFVEEQVAP